MPALSILEILDRVQAVHRQVAARYREIARTTDNDQIRLLAEDMERRERRFSDCIADFEVDGTIGKANSWLQFLPDEVVRIERLSERLAVPKSIEELVEETITLNAGLIGAYRMIARHADLPEVRELFGNLAELEENNDRHYAKMLLNS